MQTNTTNAKKTNWLLIVIAGFLLYLFFTGWADFKEGYVEGYSRQTKAKP